MTKEHDTPYGMDLCCESLGNILIRVTISFGCIYFLLNIIITQFSLLPSLYSMYVLCSIAAYSLKVLKSYSSFLSRPAACMVFSKKMKFRFFAVLLYHFRHILWPAFVKDVWFFTPFLKWILPLSQSYLCLYYPGNYSQKFIVANFFSTNPLLN